MSVSLMTRIKYRLYFRFRIPVIAFVRPRLLKLDEEEIQVLIPLRRRSRNHLNSMYLGALVVGADLAAGLLAVTVAEDRPGRIVPIFKDIRGEFFRRTEKDALFICRDGRTIREMAEEALNTGERVTRDITVSVHEKGNTEAGPSAEFSLALSVKRVKSEK